LASTNKYFDNGTSVFGEDALGGYFLIRNGHHDHDGTPAAEDAALQNVAEKAAATEGEPHAGSEAAARAHAAACGGDLAFLTTIFSPIFFLRAVKSRADGCYQRRNDGRRPLGATPGR
jgi:hypothetical protein